LAGAGMCFMTYAGRGVTSLPSDPRSCRPRRSS